MAPQHFIANWGNLLGMFTPIRHEVYSFEDVRTELLIPGVVPLVLLFQDILKDQWSPALTIKTALLSLQALLCSPEPGDPQDAQVAKMYKSSRAEFDRTAKFWTESFAKPTSKEDAINRVCEMGFPREQAQKALEEAKWDENAAVAALLNAL
jgi:NACalpha-BTF3-like transcription factor